MKHQSTILIESPEDDPAKKRPRKTTEYDPEHPSMTYECSVCYKKFKKLSSLNRHMDTHNPTKEFMCDECGLGFMKKDSLGPHYRKNHPDVPIPIEVLTTEVNSNKLKPVKFTIWGKKSSHKAKTPTPESEDPALAALIEKTIQEYKMNKH